MKTMYSGFIKILQDTISLKNGGTCNREIVKVKNAVAVLGYCPELNKFAMVRQYRAPIFQEMTEIIAGGVEEDEDALECAKREVLEETGREMIHYIYLGSIYPSPGYTMEKIDLYFGILSDTCIAQNLDKDEEIQIVYLAEDEIQTQILNGQIQDAKTITAFYQWKAIV